LSDTRTTKKRDDPTGYRLDVQVKKLIRQLKDGKPHGKFRCRRCGWCCREGACSIRPFILGKLARYFVPAVRGRPAETSAARLAWINENFVGYRRNKDLKGLVPIIVFKPLPIGSDPKRWGCGCRLLVERDGRDQTTCRLWAVREFEAFRRLRPMCERDKE
jgi:hypothetical protein